MSHCQFFCGWFIQLLICKQCLLHNVSTTPRNHNWYEVFPLQSSYVKVGRLIETKVICSSYIQVLSYLISCIMLLDWAVDTTDPGS